MVKKLFFVVVLFLARQVSGLIMCGAISHPNHLMHRQSTQDRSEHPLC